jgi:hypothetical protein
VSIYVISQVASKKETHKVRILAGTQNVKKMSFTPEKNEKNNKSACTHPAYGKAGTI